MKQPRSGGVFHRPCGTGLNNSTYLRIRLSRDGAPVFQRWRRNLGGAYRACGGLTFPTTTATGGKDAPQAPIPCPSLWAQVLHNNKARLGADACGNLASAGRHLFPVPCCLVPGYGAPPEHSLALSSTELGARPEGFEPPTTWFEVRLLNCNLL